MTTSTDGRDATAPDTTPGLHARIEELDDRIAALEAVTGIREPARRRAHHSVVSGLAQPRTVPDPGVLGGLVGRSEPLTEQVTGPVRSAVSGTRLPLGSDWSRLPVWAGAVVTVGGVVMLLALAATAGWLSPLVRVVCGAALGAALVGAGTRVTRRSGPGTSSAALAGTGILALFCSAAAATALYSLLPVAAGLTACLAVAAGGIALADRWRSLPLALGVLIAGEIVLPVVGGGPGPLGLGLALVLQAAAGASALRRADRDRWAVLNPVAALATAVHGLLAAVVALITYGTGDDVAVVAVAALALALGTAVAALAALRPPPVPPVLTQVLAPLPLLVSAAVLGGVAGAAVAAASGIALATVAAVRALYRGIRLGAAAAAAVLVMTATALVLDGRSLTLALLVEALALLTVAAVLRMRVVLAAGIGYAVPGVALCVALLAQPSALTGPLGRWDALEPVGAGLLVLLAAGALAAARRSGLLGAGGRPAGAWIPSVIIGLYGVAWLVVVGTQLVRPGAAGFLTGHVLVTVGITVLGLVVLARAATPASAADRSTGWAGFVLLGAALAKLVLFDLIALDGLGRVAAFIGAGLLLLAAGGRHASRTAAHTAGAGPEPEDEGPAGAGRGETATPGSAS
ncbi:MAG: DUF2339 domain-containing protein [Pseudonocardia sp.]|nr:DUF2339 domain-containing protein [Pseudonocardia sp.]